MKLYRVENLRTKNGMWYKEGGEISNVGEVIEFTNFDLPMEYNPYLADNNFQSAAFNLSDIRFWFAERDLARLMPLGYGLYELDVNRCEEYRQPGTDISHAIFKESDVVSRKRLVIGYCRYNYPPLPPRVP